MLLTLVMISELLDGEPDRCHPCNSSGSLSVFLNVWANIQMVYGPFMEITPRCASAGITKVP